MEQIQSIPELNRLPVVKFKEEQVSDGSYRVIITMDDYLLIVITIAHSDIAVFTLFDDTDDDRELIVANALPINELVDGILKLINK